MGARACGRGARKVGSLSRRKTEVEVWETFIRIAPSIPLLFVKINSQEDNITITPGATYTTITTTDKRSLLSIRYPYGAARNNYYFNGSACHQSLGKWDFCALRGGKTLKFSALRGKGPLKAR